jgi:hypothetical protein
LVTEQKLLSLVETEPKLPKPLPISLLTYAGICWWEVKLRNIVIGYPRFKAWTENGDGRAETAIKLYWEFLQTVDNRVCSRSTTEETGKFKIKLFCKTVQTANSFENFYKI